MRFFAYRKTRQGNCGLAALSEDVLDRAEWAEPRKVCRLRCERIPEAPTRAQAWRENLVER
jgi:hypothetical protein